MVVLQGNTTGVNIAKGAFVQVGFDMEEAARVSGAGWLRTYFRIWLPLLMPTMVLLGTLNFNIAAGTTASIILLASRDSVTLSILLLNHVIAADREMAAAISIIIGSMTLVTALIAREWGRRMTVRHR